MGPRPTLFLILCLGPVFTPQQARVEGWGVRGGNRRSGEWGKAGGQGWAAHRIEAGWVEMMMDNELRKWGPCSSGGRCSRHAPHPCRSSWAAKASPMLYLDFRLCEMEFLMLSQGEVTVRPWAVGQPSRSAEELGARDGNSGVWIIRSGGGVAGRPVCLEQK